MLAAQRIDENTKLGWEDAKLWAELHPQRAVRDGAVAMAVGVMLLQNIEGTRMLRKGMVEHGPPAPAKGTGCEPQAQHGLRSPIGVVAVVRYDAGGGQVCPKRKLVQVLPKFVEGHVKNGMRLGAKERFSWTW